MAKRIHLQIVLVAGLLLGLSSIASAASWGRSSGYLYEKLFNNMGDRYLSLLESKATDNPNNLSPDKRAICLKRYGGILNDNVLDIRIALGYFDWTTGSNVSYAGSSYGVSPSMDIGAFEALKELLTSRCSGNARFCGFTKSPDNPSLFIRDVQIHGRRIQARVEIRFSSQSEILSDNLGRYREQQIQRTQYMENFFSKALREADAVFYFGHSRNGGGPDFAPPVFISGTNKLNYNGYYKAQRPGFKKMLNALSTGPKQAPVVGLMSCASRDHFLSRTRATAPDTGIITSMDVLNVDEVYTAMIGGIDALLRGQCQQSFYQSLRMTSNNQKYITMDGMFE